METELSRYRNIGIMAHIDAGKTTTTERILYYTGRNHRIGEVHEGAATMDWMVQEQERGITITSAATTVYWKDHRINIIDTPGHVDFTIEVERSLRVLDGAVGVFDAANGVEPQSETVWRQADRYHVPRIAFLNKMDKVGADVEMCLESMRTKLNVQPLLMQLALGSESSFRGMIDVVERRLYRWESDDKDGEMIAEDIPADLHDDVELHRYMIVEAVADYDDAIAECVLADQPVEAAAIWAALRRAVCQIKIIPVFVGSAFKNKGVRPLLDAVVRLLPSPLDVPPAQGVEVEDVCQAETRKPDASEPFSGIVFKIATDPFVGSLAFIRIYSGKMDVGKTFQNVIKGKKERVIKIFLMHSNNRDEIQVAGPGDIVAVAGLRFATTGDTLADIKHPICFEAMTFPDPVISLAIEPKASSDFDKLHQCLQKMEQEDPTLKVSVSEDTGQVIIAGMGELHLQIIADRLLREFKVPANVGRPQVSYRECITTAAHGKGEFSRVIQGKTVSASVTLAIDVDMDNTHPTVDVPALHNAPKQVLNTLREALQGATASGALIGYPLVHVKAAITDFSFDPTLNDEVCYRVATANAFRNAMDQANPVLMEPVMAVEVVVPPDFSGTIVNDANTRRGRVVGIDTRSHLQVVHAEIPLAELFGYETDIRSLSQGRASSSMQFDHYETLPKNLQNKVLGVE